MSIVIFDFPFMSFLPNSIQNLIDELSKLPGIGPKTAQRLTFYLLKAGDSPGKLLGEAILRLKNGVEICSSCFNLTTENPCKICRNVYRDQATICVVEDFLDVVALEKTMEYKGLYHVLHGALSPIDGIGPDKLKIQELVTRLKNTKVPVTEIILATNPSLEGEATATYLTNLLKPLGVKTTRTARGLPVGGDLDYADEITLKNALQGRREY